MTDELEDVDLRGRALVSDDPNDWIIPPGLAEAESLFDWWERLHQMDTMLSDSLVHACKGVLEAWKNRGAWWQRSIFGHTKTMLIHGFTLEQIEECTGVPVRRVCDKKLLSAYEQLKQGVPLDEVCKGLAVGQIREVQSLHRIIKGEAKPPVLIRRRPEIKAFALEQWANGVDRRTIAKQIETKFGETVKPDAVSQWVHRDKERKAKAS